MAVVIGEIFWRQAVADLHEVAATYPPDPRREIALAELSAHVHAARFGEALGVGEAY